MLNLKVIGQRICRKRKEQGLNQNELADALYVTRQAVSKWEIGQSIPSVDVLVKLTQMLKISIDDLLDQSDLKNHAYQDMLESYPRSSIISRFLNSECPNNHVKDIFHLLVPKERKRLINQALNQQIDIHTFSIWPYASVDERKYIVTRLISHHDMESLEKLYPFMTDEERLMVSFQNHQFTVIYHGRRKTKKEERKR